MNKYITDKIVAAIGIIAVMVVLLVGINSCSGPFGSTSVEIHCPKGTTEINRVTHKEIYAACQATP